MPTRTITIRTGSLLGVTCLVMAAIVGTHAGAGTIIPICAAPGDQQLPAINGSTIVWEDHRAQETTGADIYAFDLPTATQRQICTATGDQWTPRISGSTIVWQDARRSATAFDICSYDLSTGTESVVRTNSQEKWSPVVGGTRVVWEELQNGSGFDILSAVLGTGTAQPVCSAPDDQGALAISGDILVWQDLRNGKDYNIYAYDFTTNQERVVCTATDDQLYPDVWGTRIVWEDYRTDSDGDIYMYDLATGVETPICTASGSQWEPAIYGDFIVWQDNRNGNWDIYIYDLKAKKESALVVQPGDQEVPDIHGNRVVYQNSGANDDIYMTFIDPPSYQHEDSLGVAKSLTDGAAVTISGQIVTAVFSGFFYAEQSDRSSGIKVEWPLTMNQGDQVTVSGIIATQNGERTIQATSVTSAGSTEVPRPVLLTNRNVGGGPLNSSTPGVTNGLGLNNLGLLVRTTGEVVHVGDTFFDITDGSGPQVRILCVGLTKPAVDDDVVATGISTTAESAERAVRVRTQSDIVKY